MISFRNSPYSPVQRAPEPKQPEPIRVRHAKPTQLTKTKVDMEERDAQIIALFNAGKGVAQIGRLLGYQGAGGVSKRLLKLGLRTPGYKGRPR